MKTYIGTTLLALAGGWTLLFFLGCFDFALVDYTAHLMWLVMAPVVSYLYVQGRKLLK